MGPEANLWVIKLLQLCLNLHTQGRCIDGLHTQGRCIDGPTVRLLPLVGWAGFDNVLATSWVLLKDPLVGRWVVLPKIFQPKYTIIHVRDLSYKFQQ